MDFDSVLCLLMEFLTILGEKERKCAVLIVVAGFKPARCYINMSEIGIVNEKYEAFYWFSEYTRSNSFISICTSGDVFKRASNFCLLVNTCSFAIASSMIY